MHQKTCFIINTASFTNVISNVIMYTILRLCIKCQGFPCNKGLLTCCCIELLNHTDTICLYFRSSLLQTVLQDFQGLHCFFYFFKMCTCFQNVVNLSFSNLKRFRCLLILNTLFYLTHDLSGFFYFIQMNYFLLYVQSTRSHIK